MCQIIYYLCCFGWCCGSQDKYVKKEDKKERTKTQKQLKAIIPKDTGIKRVASHPLSIKTKDISDYHEIPNNSFKTELDVISSYGFKIGNELGQGASGTVFLAKHIKTDLNVAVKVYEIPVVTDKQSKKERDKALRCVKRELFILEGITHPHIIQMIQHFLIVYNQITKLYMFMQFAENGSLSTLLRSKGPFNENTCKQWFAQMLSAMVYMHKKGFAHRDLKLSNILLDKTDDILVADFGYGQVIWRSDTSDKPGKIESRTYCGTPLYMAPEILEKRMDRSLLGKTYDSLAVDVWSMGVILFVLLNHHYPFNITKMSLKNAVLFMKEKRWGFTHRMLEPPTPQLQTIMDGMLEPDPNKRETTLALTKFEWIKDTYKSVEDHCMERIKSMTKINVFRKD